MKLLIVGGGGREHALATVLHRSPLKPELWAAPGNPGIAQLARCVPISADDIDRLVALAERERFDLTVVGPEVPLTKGLVDRLEALGLPAFGPRASAAELEGSKAFAKALMQKAGIPTAAFMTTTVLTEALAFVSTCPLPVVVKADGLAAGKGVMIASTRAEAEAAVRELMDARILGEAGARLVIEEFLPGEEASFLAICDGEDALPLASAQDHKQVFDGDQGPNTGGMGVISPTPLVTPALEQRVLNDVIRPTLRAMQEAGRPFRGVLYAGLMIHQGVPRVLEFNARFGDPETQALLSRLDDDLLPVLLAAATGSLRGHRLRFKPGHAVTVVLAAKGYPGSFKKGMLIQGLEQELPPDVQVYQAGTALDSQGRVVTSGGRVLAVTALGETFEQAHTRAYAACDQLTWEEQHYRRDIGHRSSRLGAS